MDEVNTPATERQENSPRNIITQHSHASGSEPEDEHVEDAPMEEDAEIRDPGEIPKNESEDSSPETNQDMGDPDNEEGDDQFMFNFDEETLEDEDEDRNDAGDEERIVKKDQQTPEQPKGTLKADTATKVSRPSIFTAISLSSTELEALK